MKLSDVGLLALAVLFLAGCDCSYDENTAKEQRAAYKRWCEDNGGFMLRTCQFPPAKPAPPQEH